MSFCVAVANSSSITLKSWNVSLKNDQMPPPSVSFLYLFFWDCSFLPLLFGCSLVILLLRTRVGAKGVLVTMLPGDGRDSGQSGGRDRSSPRAAAGAAAVLGCGHRHCGKSSSLLGFWVPCFLDPVSFSFFLFSFFLVYTLDFLDRVLK